MNITPEQFLQSLKEGKTERELNLTENLYFEPTTLKYIMHVYGYKTEESALAYLQTDHSNGFTICGLCGSYYHLGMGFIKHLSKGCIHCEGESKHKTHLIFVYASPLSDIEFPVRSVSLMFDDGIGYSQAKLEIEKYKSLI